MLVKVGFGFAQPTAYSRTERSQTLNPEIPVLQKDAPGQFLEHLMRKLDLVLQVDSEVKIQRPYFGF
jgi:hypothetical protein